MGGGREHGWKVKSPVLGFDRPISPDMASRSSSTPRGGAVVASQVPAAIRRLLWTVGVVLWAGLLASLLSFNTGDPPSHALAPLNQTVTNWMGPAGAWVAYQTVSMIGSGIWILMICTGAGLAAIAYRGSVTHPALRAIGVLMVALAYSGFHALFMPWASSFPEGGGGLVAIAGVHELQLRFGSLGAALWLTLMAVVGLTVAFDDWFNAAASAAARPFAAVASVAGSIGSLARALMPAKKRRSAAPAKTAKAKSALEAKSADAKGKGAAISPPQGHSPSGMDAPVDSTDLDEIDVEDVEAESESLDESEEHLADGADGSGDDGDDAAEPGDEADEADAFEAESSDEDDGSDDDASEASPSFDPQTLRAKMAKLPVRFAGADRRAATQEDLDVFRAAREEEEAAKNYVFPGLDLLIDPEPGYEAALDAYVRDQAQALEGALHTYNIKGTVAGIESGPVITLYQVRLAPGTKVSAITAVASDIARALKSVNIRVVPNTEGLDTVGIEVPNRKKEKVRLKELMTRSDALSKMKLPLFLGKDASGRPLVIDLATLPHMLIAGTTGSGKSVCMNAIIMGFLYTQRPNDLKLVLVDPKVVELSQFKDIPHLMCPVVTDMSKAAAILEWAVGKMDERYELLAEAGCRDIASYNSLSWDELKERMNPQGEDEEARIPRRLPYMVFIIDELADLMMTNKEVEGSIVRIAQKARAVGIHLILATQRPQANVVTGLIKSNMPGRLSFKVASGMDSRIVLDQKGGELLLGQGDMLFITPRNSVPMRAQGTLVDDQEIRNVVRFVRQVSGPSFERQLVQLRGGDASGAAAFEPGSAEHEQRMLENAQEDPLFDRAVEIVLETKRGSVSLLQRRLAIGYTRASRLIELMGMAGIIGDHKGSVAREVSMTVEEWQAIKKQAELDAQEAKESGKSKPAAPGQPKLFPEPVTAKEVLESRGTSERGAGVAPVSSSADTLPAHLIAGSGASLAGAVLANAPEVEEPPFDVPEPADAIEEAEDEAVEDSEASDEAEALDDADEGEDDEAELEDDASAEAEDDEEYEYEYVEVDDESELEGEDYEIVEEVAEEPESPEVVVKPARARGQGSASDKTE